MEIRHLKAFVAVATDGHFGRAAARLNLTQPGLTLRIQALEKELGRQLFARSAREVQLTAAGALLLPHAKSLLRIEDRARRELRDQADGVTRRLRISYVSHGAVAFPSEVVAGFRRRHPDVQVETTAGHSAMNAAQLLDGRIDAAFVYPGFVGVAGVMPDGVAVRLLERDRVVLAVSENHPLAKLHEVPITALRREPIITFSTSPGSSAPKRFIDLLTRLMGSVPNIAAFEPPDQALEAVAHSTSVVTFANGSRAVSAPVPGVAYLRVTPPLLLDFGLAYARDDDSPALADLLQLVDEMAPGKPGELPEGGELLTD